MGGGGAHERHPDFEAHLRKYLASIQPENLDAYQAGIVCMLVETYGDPSYLPVLRAVAQPPRASGYGRLLELPPRAAARLLQEGGVYGHRKRAIEAGASEDTALEVPLRRLVKKEMLAKLDALRPRGKTPMARSLLEAKRDLGSATPENPVTVVLLTDGGEDTLPRQDPLAAAAEMSKLLKGVRFHIVGFDIGREDWRAQLEAMAVKGEGRYWPARSAESPLGELRSAVFAVPAGFSVAGEDGRAAGGGRFGDSLVLHEGRYVLRTSYAGVDYEEAFWINTAATTSVVFNAARVAQLRLPPPAPGAAAAPAAAPEVKPAPSPRAKPAPAPAPAPGAKFCTSCGTALKPGASFCTGCGTKVKG